MVAVATGRCKVLCTLNGRLTYSPPCDTARRRHRPLTVMFWCARVCAPWLRVCKEQPVPQAALTLALSNVVREHHSTAAQAPLRHHSDITLTDRTAVPAVLGDLTQETCPPALRESDQNTAGPSRPTAPKGSWMVTKFDARAQSAMRADSPRFKSQ